MVIVESRMTPLHISWLTLTPCTGVARAATREHPVLIMRAKKDKASRESYQTCFHDKGLGFLQRGSMPGLCRHFELQLEKNGQSSKVYHFSQRGKALNAWALKRTGSEKMDGQKLCQVTG